MPYSILTNIASNVNMTSVDRQGWHVLLFISLRIRFLPEIIKFATEFDFERNECAHRHSK